ncbi:hypothetical protein TNCV_2270951 [Trichonephila clavipes]|nr:hypothetical protein TNCV_2270951 [Trichonephila clavipes]
MDLLEIFNKQAAAQNTFDEAGKPTPSPFDHSAQECHKPGFDLQTTVPRKCPSSPEDEQEKQGESRTGKERVNPLHKDHTTQVTTSKACQDCLKNPGSPVV